MVMRTTGRKRASAILYVPQVRFTYLFRWRLFAVMPNAWLLDGLPKFVWMYGSIASTTDLSMGVVAL